MNFQEIVVRVVRPFEEPHYREQIQNHHYLGFLPKIGETPGTLPPGMMSGLLF